MALAASPISIEHGHGGEDRPAVLSYDPRSSQLETSRLDHVAEDEQNTMAVPINARDGQGAFKVRSSRTGRDRQRPHRDCRWPPAMTRSLLATSPARAVVSCRAARTSPAVWRRWRWNRGNKAGVRARRAVARSHSHLLGCEHMPDDVDGNECPQI